ncbi:hypothetical protein FCM35_KLT04031 [Carex littledalei]|uniref:Uncharacterized protein n=1 Tax=Carex littledalei TaxID=544730 RepID=A0A833R0V7_9POAL|nr:hypothetical protein FCM35_KLT04031 [Carex littledalei]
MGRGGSKRRHFSSTVKSQSKSKRTDDDALWEDDDDEIDAFHKQRDFLLMSLKGNQTMRIWSSLSLIFRKMIVMKAKTRIPILMMLTKMILRPEALLLRLQDRQNT